MADAHTLLQQYISEHRGGGDADPRRWLEQVEGAERAKLAGLIDVYLEQAPMHPWDPDGFRESGLAGFAERLNESLYSRAGLWPVVLPDLRERARLKRADLVERLAAALGAQDRQAKVGSYYHQMETGELPSEGVSDRVLKELAAILGQSVEALRDAGRLIGGGGETTVEASPAFARTALAKDLVLESRAPASPGIEEEPDEVDRLFRGG
jgi:hypothetical protein